jgi:hypothetical protein
MAAMGFTSESTHALLLENAVRDQIRDREWDQHIRSCMYQQHVDWSRGSTPENVARAYEERLRDYEQNWHLATPESESPTEDAPLPNDLRILPIDRLEGTSSNTPKAISPKKRTAQQAVDGEKSSGPCVHINQPNKKRRTWVGWKTISDLPISDNDVVSQRSLVEVQRSGSKRQKQYVGHLKLLPHLLTCLGADQRLFAKSLLKL